MKIVDELPKFTKVEIVQGAAEGFYIKCIENGDTLNKPFDSIRAAVQYTVGAFLIVQFAPGQLK